MGGRSFGVYEEAGAILGLESILGFLDGLDVDAELTLVLRFTTLVVTRVVLADTAAAMVSPELKLISERLAALV